MFYCALNKDAVNEWKRLLGIHVRNSSSSTGKSSEAKSRKRKLTQSTTDISKSRSAKKQSISSVRVASDSISETGKQREEVKRGSLKRFPVCGYKKDDTDGLELIHVEIEQGKSTP